MPQESDSMILDHARMFPDIFCKHFAEQGVILGRDGDMMDEGWHGWSLSEEECIDRTIDTPFITVPFPGQRPGS